MKKIVATGKESLSNTTEMHVGPTPPLYPVEGQLWLNTSTTPPTLYKWDGTKWILQEMDVEKLDPEFVEKINNEIDEKHQETLDEIKRINDAAQALKDAVLAQNEANEKYFKEVNAEIDKFSDDLAKTNDVLQITNEDIIANRSELLGLVGELDGKHSVLAQNVNGIATRVSDAEGNISTVTQTAKSLGTRLTSAEGNISTFTQTANTLGARLTSAEGNISTFTQTANTLSTKVSNVEGSVSQLTQTANGLQSTVNSITNGTASVITQMKDSINLKVSSGNLVSQINASSEGLYLAGKLIYLDSNVAVAGTFTAPKVISGDSYSYTKIENKTLTSYGYYSADWTDGYVSGYHSMTANLGYIAMKQETGSWSNNTQPTLYYTARGISTYFGANSSASGTIEFFAEGYSTTANSLRVKSSGNIILESTATNGSRIYLNPKGPGVHVGDANGSYYNLYAARIICSEGANITSNSTNRFTFGNFYTNDTNINSSNDAIKIGGGTGNIVCTKVTETSAREKKKNITPFEKDATAIINSSYIRNYQYLDDKDIDLPYVGLILDEAPLEVVDTFGNGVLPSNATFVAWKAIQELSARITELEGKVA